MMLKSLIILIALVEAVRNQELDNSKIYPPSNYTQLNNTQLNHTNLNSSQLNTHTNVTQIDTDTEHFGQCGLNIEEIENCIVNTCNGRCGKRSNYTLGGSLCSCDDACTVFGDCCSDFDSECSHNRENKFPGMQPDDFTCKEHSPGTFVYMKHSCKPDFHDEDIIRQCKMNRGFESMVPVSDLNTKMVYSNYFCALCNDAKDIALWQLNVKCMLGGSLPDNLVWNEFIKMFYDLEGIQRKCNVHSQPPKILHLTPPRCIHVSSKCRGECQDSNIIKLCKNGEYSPQHSAFDIVRNKYCIQCQNRKKCLNPMTEKETFLKYTFSYTLLCDVINGAGMKVELEPEFGLNKINALAEVKEGKIHFTKCNAPFIFQNGKCELNGMYISISCQFDINLMNGTHVGLKLSLDQERIIHNILNDIYDTVGLVRVWGLERNRMNLKWYVSMPYDTDIWRAVLLDDEKILLNALNDTFPEFDLEMNECIYSKSEAVPRATTVSTNANSTIKSGGQNPTVSSSPTFRNSIKNFIILISIMCSWWIMN